MRFLNHDKQEFRWGDEMPVIGKKRKYTYYRSFCLDNKKFEIEDFVMIRNDDSVDPEDVLNCYIGQIKELFDTGDEFEPHQSKVQWFSRVSEIPVHVQKLIDHYREREVVEENRPQWCDIIDADTIFGKCVVSFLPADADCGALEYVFKESEIPAFFCRYRFIARTLLPVLNKNNPPLAIGSAPVNVTDYLKKSPHKRNREKKRVGKETGTPTTSERYCIISPSSEFPKVLIKRIDNEILEGCNHVKTAVAQSCSSEAVDDVTNAMQSSLSLRSQPSNTVRPFIHKIQNVNSDQGANGVPTDPHSQSASSDLNECNSSVFETEERVRKSNRIQNPSLDRLYESPQKHLKTEISLTPKKYSKSVVNSPKLRTPSRSRKPASVASTPRRARKTDTDRNTPIGITPTRRSLRKKDNTPCYSVVSDGPSRKSVKLKNCDTPSKVVENSKNKPTPKRSEVRVSPLKTPKTARRSIQFTSEHEEVTTRSGRKVKQVNYASQLDDDERLKTVLSKNKLSKFLKINYSEDSDSGSAFSGSDSSSADEFESEETETPKKKKYHSASAKKIENYTPKSRARQKLELTIPERKTPLKAAQNVLEESRLRLHVSAVPKSLPCREEEYSDIYSFVRGCLSSHTGGCMYISGVPGTGKTATVHEVIRNLEEERQNGEVPLFTFVEVNGMWMTDPYQCYVHIFKALTGKTIASQQAANLLEKRFTEAGPKKDAVVLLVDELDRLWTRKQTVMYNIFDWPSKKHSKLIVLAIANTMDLPERLMMNRVSSRLGLTRKTFQPYNFRQLQEIIMSRIQELKVFDPDAVQFVSRKVAAVSGDARRALDICRHATEVAGKKPSSPKKKCKIVVGMEHVDEAIQQMFSSPVIAAIESSSKLAKMFLQCILSEFARIGSEETTFYKVSKQLSTSCTFEGVKIPTSTEIHNICSQLVSCHLILVDNFQNDLYMKIRLSVSPDDASYALNRKD